MAASDAPGTSELLERAADLGALEDDFAAVSANGRGRMVLVEGEAGIGKTALVRAFCGERNARQVLAGACDALFTPRPLGPLLDIAREAGGELAAAADEGVTPAAIVGALHSELQRRRPAVLVLEDLHWADETTHDVVRLLARRIETVPALVLVTFRGEELDRTEPVRIVLGEPPAAGVERFTLRPLSPEAVARLAGAGKDTAAAGELYRR